MNALRNLSLSVKLGLLALVPLALLTGLVAGVLGQMGAIADGRAREGADIAIERRVREVAVAAAALQAQNRALFAAQTAAAITAIRQDASRATAAAIGEVEAIARDAAPGSHRGAVRAYLGALRDLDAAIGARPSAAHG
jgi:hypothetical protein